MLGGEVARVGEVGPSGGAGVARHLYFRTHWIDEERIRRDQEKSRRESAKTRRKAGGNLPKPGECQEGARKGREKTGGGAPASSFLWWEM